MKKTIILFSLLMVVLSVHADDISAVKGLVHRLFPGYEQVFSFRKTAGKTDVFSLRSEGGKIIVSGNNANSMAVGINHYMKYYCHVEVGWLKSDTFQLPSVPPRIPKPVTIKARVKDRFFLNYCTYGYTMPWWRWDEWEHFIDWMALNGINLPLAITGQESIWYKVWSELGLSDATIRNYFTGPAHLPWHRMINIDRWFAPLPMSWLNGQLMLQKRITARERELNMHPVLPAFSGHVPAELASIFPKAKITKLAPWDGYAEQYSCSFLDPMDPLFTQIQRRFIEIEDSVYGTDHVYGIDLFNEVTPPSYAPEYLSRVAKQVYASLANADPQAIWLQMTWLFYYRQKDWTNDRIKAYLTAYPKNRSLLLDYYCDMQEIWKSTDKFFGVPFVWCYLGNFGGNTMLTGDLETINRRMEHAMAKCKGNLAGIGATLEGFDCNPYIYEYVFEKAWNFPANRNVQEWVNALADQRTGKVDANARQAWQLLVDSIYNQQTVTQQRQPFFNMRPAFMTSKMVRQIPQVDKEDKILLEVIEKLLQVDSDRQSYHFDLANLTRQLLTNHFMSVFYDYQKAYEAKDLQTMRLLAKKMTTIIEDLDKVVGTQSCFLTGKWIKDARAWGKDPMEKLYYEQNARNIITTWSDKNMGLNDYAYRSWAGMVKTFYGERWRMFFKAVEAALKARQHFDKAHYDSYKDRVCTFEKYWWEGCVGNFKAVPTGDSKTVVREILAKYQ